ncbi:DNA/RNA non-specific endonuclease [Citrobacter sp. RHB25-C09]|uniref:DNA/RNA non-specific endonuclease n=1 Tax=Citrobacter sp. RHB25-C09 TaxID=2742624 RepID=UPI0015EEC94F|nr:DNA/RNA non-specific endonuclease [Citrobacter sp. RHB25-C09]QMI05395.1 DNA/RNA non-specific endonuclease [Citrobacter sp. RHB25-C09]
MAFFRIADDQFRAQIASAKARKKPQIRGDQDSARAARIDNIQQSGAGFSGRDYERMIGRNDLLPVNYFERGAQAARAVGRIGAITADNFGDVSHFWGTCFLVSPHLILTNHHVIENFARAASAIVEFNYQRDISGNIMPTRRFRLNPEMAFFTSPLDAYDYSLIGVDPVAMSGGFALADQGLLRLNPNLHKVEEHEFVSLIQHPGAEEKYVSIRENKVVQIGDFGLAVPDHCIWYTCDTAAGTSGAPVFSDQWQVVALHHCGIAEAKIVNGEKKIQLVSGRWVSESEAEQMHDSDVKYQANEGIRVSVLLADLRQQLAASPNSTVQALFDDIDGIRAFSNLPRQESVVAPGFTSAVIQPESAKARRKPTKNRYEPQHFEGRKGYQASFLGAAIQLPVLTDRALRFGRVAEVTGRDDGELKYEHFSILFNADRHMAFFTAVNIDGSQSVGFDRDTDKWYYDPRVAEELQIGDDFYTNEAVPTKNYFDRGHLVRRLDPVWGTADEAARANQDTFVFTNCTPQYFAFNQRDALWQGLEKFILSNTDDDNLKASVFTGPVFIDDESQSIAGELLSKDEIHRGVLIPQAFWKVVVVTDAASRLYASAYIVSQAQWAKNLPFEALPVGKFRDYQVSVAQLQAITGLKFDALVEVNDVGRHLTTLQPLRGLADISHPRRGTTTSYGRFVSFTAFLDSWERMRAQLEAPTPDLATLEAKVKRRERDVVDINAVIVEYSGVAGEHQHAILNITAVNQNDPDIQADIQRVIKEREPVFLAIRVGDHLGLPVPVPDLARDVSLHLKGEWIPRDKAYNHGGEKMSVIHFTHHPLGFVCTPTNCFS